MRLAAYTAAITALLLSHAAVYQYATSRAVDSSQADVLINASMAHARDQITQALATEQGYSITTHVPVSGEVYYRIAPIIPTGQGIAEAVPMVCFSETKNLEFNRIVQSLQYDKRDARAALCNNHSL